MEPVVIDEQSQRLYRQWGDYFTKKDLLNEANIYYTKCLEINSRDAQALYSRSICLCNFGKCRDAVKDAKAALELIPHRLDINLQVSTALFDSNDFVNSAVELHNNSRKFDKINLKKFENRLQIIHANYVHSLGDKYVVFAHNNNIAKIFEDLKHLDENDRPLWKILKEQDKCDVLSILEKEEELLHPREIARRKLCYKNFTQLYLHKGSKDLQFLSDLRKNKSYLLPQTTKSTRKLTKFTEKNYDIAYTFLKMLQARCPVFSQKYKTGRNQIFVAREKENHMLRLQCQTRRNMFNILKKIHNLRAEGKLDELSKVVDYAIREYVILKTFKVMPRKFEFINEVCNILALAYIDKIEIPDNLMNINNTHQKIMILLNVSLVKENDYPDYVFGDKSTYKDPEAKDPGFILYNNRLNILEKRLRFATFPIEKCYFYHEIAVSHLKQSKNDMCITIAIRAIAEAHKCQNIAWEILAYKLICKTLIIQEKLEKLLEILVTMVKIVRRAKNSKLLHVFQTCKKFTDEALAEKRAKLTSSVLNS